MMASASEWGEGASLVMLLIVLIVDALIGGLPVIRPLLGVPLGFVRHLTKWFDARLNRENRGLGARRMRGLVVVIVVITLAWLFGAVAEYFSRQLPHGWIVEALCVLALLHQRECLDRMRLVARAVAANDSGAARDAVASLVRYDTARLDGYALSRAAIEGGSARLAGRLLGTVFWYLLLGLPGLCVYRANSAIADVIGRPSPRHAAFGFVPARLDDALSLVPALLAGPLLVMSALFVPKSAPIAAMKGWVRDLVERGFKAGYRAEGAMAGALGVALGGARPFDGVALPGAWIGDGRARATVYDVDRAVFLIAVACLLTGVGLALGVMGQSR
jgi:adenosylcobinamide-phosphate synthase